MSRERAERSAQRIREAPTERRRGSAVSERSERAIQHSDTRSADRARRGSAGGQGCPVSGNRGTGGRDGEAGAAERRLSEALRAQASLGARSSARTGRRPRRSSPRLRNEQARSPQARSNRGRSRRARIRLGRNRARPTRQGPATPTPVGQSGPHGRGGQSGPQHAAPRPGPGHGAPHGPGRRTRPRDDQLPTTKVATADPGQAEAPTTQQPSAHPAAAPAGPPGPRPRPRRSPRRRPAAAWSWTSGCAWRCSSASSPELSSGPRSPCCRCSIPGCSPPWADRVTASAAPCCGSGVLVAEPVGEVVLLRPDHQPGRGEHAHRCCRQRPPGAGRQADADQGDRLPGVHRVATHAIGPGGDQPGHRTVRHDRGALPQDGGHAGGAERDPRRTDGDPGAGEGSASGTGQGQPDHRAFGDEGGGQRDGEERRREGKRTAAPLGADGRSGCRVAEVMSEGDGRPVGRTDRLADPGEQAAEPARCPVDQRRGGGDRTHRRFLGLDGSAAVCGTDPTEERSGAPRHRTTQPVVDRELVHREQAHTERVARRRTSGHVTSAPSGCGRRATSRVRPTASTAQAGHRGVDLGVDVGGTAAAPRQPRQQHGQPARVGHRRGDQTDPDRTGDEPKPRRSMLASTLVATMPPATSRTVRRAGCPGRPRVPARSAVTCSCTRTGGCRRACLRP